ncbi:site-specific integrase [Nocardia sp. NBC_01730]|uniref:tyrosine-type recombinase/integrase n=1 Tax=Nocardia sp. NBC_01730 TaxID=2975998 RepID=UPI002E114626|nr:site-specific integrase [Nocardia sp. NBC_01730]
MTATPSVNDLDTARRLLDQMQTLLAHNESHPNVPRFADYVPRVLAAMPATLTVVQYQSFLRRVAEAWPDRRIDEPTPTEFKSLIAEIVEMRQVRRNDVGGKGTARGVISALRKLYEFAVDDGYIRSEDNPGKKLAMPSLPPSRRRALSRDQLVEINRAAAESGEDPELDTLILRLHTETACRRAGVVDLREVDLDPANCLIHLREKGGITRWQPISPTLMEALQQHHRRRKPHDRSVGHRARNGKVITAEAEARLLRYRNGDPVNNRQYHLMFQRIGAAVPWVVAHQISIHWLRHTTLTWVERRFGVPVAKAYAGHTDNPGGATTLLYTRAGLPEVARALAELTGEPHPCAAASGADPNYLPSGPRQDP